MRIPAIRVRQWLTEWDSFDYNKDLLQGKPPPHFYMCSMPAPLLRRLAGVQHRQASGPRAADLGIQRGHDEDRSAEIGRYVQAGYPWASLNTGQQAQFPELRKPGWLATSIVGNLVSAKTQRYGVEANPKDIITIDAASDDFAQLILPEGSEEHSWKRSENGLDPIEIIDGQHRLFAFSQDQLINGHFDFPVVLFEDLDVSWQAYLFWTINIRPKRINPSMAYDLYPLLRTTEWLERVEGPFAYRETRAQELTEALWSHPESPWLKRIGMLGRERGKVTQAAFIRSLTQSFVRGWSGSRRRGIGGFFGTEHSEEPTDVLRWTRAQQAAYIIELWSALERTIANCHEEWANFLRDNTPVQEEVLHRDAAFGGRYSMLSTDQGVRGFLQVCNDISYERRHVVPFAEWQRSMSADDPKEEEVTEALVDLREQKEIRQFIDTLATDVSKFDWRSAVTPKLPSEVEIFQSRYRGGSGYRQVRLQLTRHLCSKGSPDIAESARNVATALGYNEE